jgi:predicted NBD/HSP70 family sugar kinase
MSDKRLLDTKRPTPLASSGALLQHIRLGLAFTRADLAALTGAARSTVSQRVDALIAAALVYEAGDGVSTGGRPPTVLAFNGDAGVVLTADLGATHSSFGVHDLNGVALARRGADLGIADGPEVVLASVLGILEELLHESGRSPTQVRGVGVGLPGPVEFASGTAVHPPIMPGWDGFPVPPHIQQHFDVPVLVDNDVNIMALGEYWTEWRDAVEDLIFVKVGTGIGSGIIVAGQIHRGAQGAAGDLGHVQLMGRTELCRCGNRGCVEAVAGGAALARSLTEGGTPASTARDVVELARGGNATAVRLIREAGRNLGEVLAGAVNFFNPAVIVMGGDVTAADQSLLAGVREVVYQRSTSLATQHLQIVRSRLGDRAGITGAAVMVIEHLLAPAAVDRQLETAVTG